MTAIKTTYNFTRSFATLLGAAGLFSFLSNQKDNIKTVFSTESFFVPAGVWEGVDARTLAFIFIALVSMDGISGFFPSKAMELSFGIKIPPKSMTRASLQALGGMASSIVLTSLLALCTELQDETVALIGSFFMLLVAIWSLVNNLQFFQSKSTLPLQIFTVLSFIALDALGVISVNKPLMFLHGISILTGVIVFFSPRVSKSMFGYDIESEGGLATELYRAFCGYHVSACTLQLLLLLHVDSLRAIGWTAAVTTTWTYEMCFLSASFDNFPKTKWLNEYTRGAAVFLLAGLSAGILI